MAVTAAAASLQCLSDGRDRLELEFFNLPFEIKLYDGEALSDNAPILLLDRRHLDAKFGQVDIAPLRPIEDRGLERLGTHDRTMDLLRRETLQIVDDVLVANLERSNWCIATHLDQ